MRFLDVARVICAIEELAEGAGRGFTLGGGGVPLQGLLVRIGGEGQRTQPAQPGQQQAPEGQGQRAQPGQPNAPNAQGRPAVPPGTTPNGVPERAPTAPAERHGDASDGHSVISLASFRDGHRTGPEHGKPGLTAQLKAAHRGTQLVQQAALYRAAAQMMNSRA